MQATVSRISPVMIELSVEVPAATVKTEIDKAYATLSKKAHIRGFRPGKVPRDVLARLFAPQVMSDVMNALVNTTLPQVLTEQNVTPITQPSVEPGKVAQTEPFSYKARFEVTPEVEDVKFEGFELYRPKNEVTDAMVDEELEGIRQRFATLKTPEPERASKAGDVVTIDFTVSVDGEAVKDGGGQGVQIELAAGQALPELDTALTGKKTSASMDVEVTFPDNHPRADFRGKKGLFHVTLTDTKERVLPALDDELAKDAGTFQTLVELRADVHTRLEKAMKDKTEMALAEQIVEKLNEANPVEVPPSLVEQQARVMEQEVALQARRMGQRITQEQLAGMAERLHEDAAKKVRAGLLMAAIARKLDVKVTDEDMDKGMAEMAEQSGKNIAKVRAEYRDKQKRDMLIGMILEDKILDLVEGKAKIVDGDPPAKAEPKAEAKKDDAKAEAKKDEAKPKGKAKKKDEKKEEQAG